MRKMLQKLPTLDNSAQRSVFEICLTSKFNVVHMIAISYSRSRAWIIKNYPIWTSFYCVIVCLSWEDKGLIDDWNLEPSNLATIADPRV